MRPAAIRTCVGSVFAAVLAVAVASAAQATPFEAHPAAVLAAQSAAQAVSGDLIVKFRDADQPGPALAARLSADLKVPLRFVQATSGRELLLALDRQALAQTLARRAVREPGVTSAEPQLDLQPGLPPQHLVVRLKQRAGTSLSALPGRLAVDGVLPQLQSRPDGSVLLQLDIDAVTEALLARIQQRADVEYAQANRLLRPAPPPTR
jgi:hypothetical protein